MGIDMRVAQVGIDTHKDFSIASARDERGVIVWRKRLEHGDREALRRELRSWPGGVTVVMEGTFGWGWVADEASAAGLSARLASSRKVAAWREARGIAKCNRTDADLLSELPMERQNWWEVWLAPQPVRDRRETLRYRMSLVKQQTETKNRVHATLHRHGVSTRGFGDLFGKKGRLFLGQLAAGEVGGLRVSARRALSGQLELLKQLRKQIAEATVWLRREVAADAQGELWRSLPGVSWVLAYTILAEVGDVNRFKDARRLASYALLAPRADESGEESELTPLGRHVGHAGRRVLKWAFIEAAHGAVRHGGYFKEVFDRRTDGGKKDRSRGYIAVGHALCRVGFACCRHGECYTEAGHRRPGEPESRSESEPQGSSEQQVRGLKQCSRPGSGQPERPMAAAW